jgi:hypothetical protein
MVLIISYTFVIFFASIIFTKKLIISAAIWEHHAIFPLLKCDEGVFGAQTHKFSSKWIKTKGYILESRSAERNSILGGVRGAKSFRRSPHHTEWACAHKGALCFFSPPLCAHHTPRAVMRIFPQKALSWHDLYKFFPRQLHLQANRIFRRFFLSRVERRLKFLMDTSRISCRRNQIGWRRRTKDGKLEKWGKLKIVVKAWNVKERLRIFPFSSSCLISSVSRVVGAARNGSIFFSLWFQGVNFHYPLFAICVQMMNTQKVMMSPEQPINYFPFPPSKEKAHQMI